VDVGEMNEVERILMGLGCVLLEILVRELCSDNDGVRLHIGESEKHARKQKRESCESSVQHRKPQMEQDNQPLDKKYTACGL
jgi:hypothetical protein